MVEFSFTEPFLPPSHYDHWDSYVYINVQSAGWHRAGRNLREDDGPRRTSSSQRKNQYRCVKKSIFILLLIIIIAKIIIIIFI